MTPLPLVALDLDGTVIRGCRLDEIRPGLLVVDRAGSSCSVTDPTVPERLRVLAAHATLVPATARDVGQLLRLRGLWHELPAWCVVACGAVVLHRGAVEPEWAAHVDSLVDAAADARDVARVLADALPAARLRHAHPAVVVAANPSAQAAPARELFLPPGWRLRRAGRKWYAVVDGVDKADAVAWLARRLGAVRVLQAAGDSVLDEPMLRRADAAFVPHRTSLAAVALPARSGGGSGHVLTVVPDDPDRPGAAIAAALVNAITAGRPHGPAVLWSR